MTGVRQAACRFCGIRITFFEGEETARAVCNTCNEARAMVEQAIALAKFSDKNVEMYVAILSSLKVRDALYDLNAAVISLNDTILATGEETIVDDGS